MKPGGRKRRLAAIFGCVMAVSAMAPAYADDIAGQWLFDTSKFAGNDCQIVGRIHFTPTAVKNTYTCWFENEQICGALNGNLYIRVRQTCTAQRVGKQVAIQSEVDRVLERRPYLPADLAKMNYLADNFILQLSANKAEMNGEHYDEQRNLNARFWRDVELIS